MTDQRQPGQGVVLLVVNDLVEWTTTTTTLRDKGYDVVEAGAAVAWTAVAGGDDGESLAARLTPTEPDQEVRRVGAAAATSQSLRREIQRSTDGHSAVLDPLPEVLVDDPKLRVVHHEPLVARLRALHHAVRTRTALA